MRVIANVVLADGTQPGEETEINEEEGKFLLSQGYVKGIEHAQAPGGEYPGKKTFPEDYRENPEESPVPEQRDSNEDTVDEDRTVEELRDELRERDLKVSGNKDELIARLNNNKGVE